MKTSSSLSGKRVFLSENELGESVVISWKDRLENLLCLANFPQN